MTDKIRLKWGTLKGWDLQSPAALELLQRYINFGVCASCMTQHDTPEQKELLVQLIELPQMEIYLDWEGKYVDATEAAKYVREYGKLEGAK